MESAHDWSALQRGNGCPFDGPRSDHNEYWDKLGALTVSTLYLHKIQTYRGYCLLVFDPRHATELRQLTHGERSAFMADVCRAQDAMYRVLRPDHFNVECLGNQIPHLHWHLIPRRRGDPRWGLPVWMTQENELPRVHLVAGERASLIKELRDALAV
jgi:diadenosine tetraphosphate (Ap4A) HIT family hydrolase